MATVAIIDDGVRSGFFNMYNIVKSIEITPDLSVQQANNCKELSINHGTICAAIVKKYYSKAIIISIKILSSKNHKCKSEQLVKAIQWCIDNHIQIANLSLGSIHYRDFEPIRKAINIAYEKGLIIVAACNNRDIFTYPASCSNVIGVKCNKVNDLKEGEYIFNLYPIDGIEITCCSEHFLFKSKTQLKSTPKCNSYAAPMITAKVCQIIDNFPNKSLEEIKKILYQCSSNFPGSLIGVNSYKNIDFISKAAILDTNKKEDDFEYNFIHQFKRFESTKDIDVNLFDTLISLNNSQKNYEKINYILHKFAKNKKNIVVIDEEYKEEYCGIKPQNNNIKFWHPSLINRFYKGDLQKKELDVPLIMVYDYTENKVVKILKELTHKFRSDGYYALGACNKPVAQLCGIEFIPENTKEDFEDIKNKIEILYRVYDFDIMILGLNIKKGNSDIVKKVNMFLQPDKTIFLVDDFIEELGILVESYSRDDFLIITFQDYMNKNFNLFKYKNMDLIYNKILDMFAKKLE